jgi:hypothetical protein
LEDELNTLASGWTPPPQYWISEEASSSVTRHICSEIHHLHSSPHDAQHKPTYEIAQWKRDAINRCHNGMVGHWGVERTLTNLNAYLTREPILMQGKPEWL